MSIARATHQGEQKAEITQAGVAKTLGVSRFYLNRVLRGHRQSKRLMDRIREVAPSLIEQQQP